MTDRITFTAPATVTADGRRIRGSVQLAGSRIRRNNEWLEIDPAAFLAADASDLVARFEHDPLKILGRASNGTVSLARTEDGFSYETADLPNTTYANDALELVRGKYVTGSSFEIEGLKYAFSTDLEDGSRVRRIVHIDRINDVSPTAHPAFAESSAAAFTDIKENKMDPVTEPVEPAAPAAPPAPPAPTVSETFSAAEKLARDTLRDSGPAALESALDNVIASFGDNPAPAQREQYEAFAKVYDEHKAATAEARQRRDNLKLAHDMRRGIVPKAPESGVIQSDEYAHAFANYLRDGNARHMEQFAQTIAGDGTQGGFTVPDGFVAKLGERLKDFGGIASVAQEITTSTGESLRWPYIDDTANKAEIVAEDTQASTGADLVFDSVELGAFEYDATGASGNPIEVSLPLIQDSAFDIEDLLLRLLSKRIGRKQADHFALGAGGTEPVGLMTKSADTMTATVASLAAPEHIFQVDRAYRDNARWVMSDTTLAKLWAAQATTNEPLFMPGRTIEGKPFDTLYGYPVTIDNAAGNSVAFGDIEAGYIIRRVRGVQLLVDPYTAQKRRAVQYHAWARADANIQDPNAYSVSSWSGVSADT